MRGIIAELHHNCFNIFNLFADIMHMGTIWKVVFALGSSRDVITMETLTDGVNKIWKHKTVGMVLNVLII
jgi:hypothetical protein